MKIASLLILAACVVCLADPPAGTLSLSGSSINSNIIFLSYPGNTAAQRKNVVTGSDPTLGGSGAVWNGTGESGGTALSSDGTAGVSWPFPAGFTASSGNWTLMMRAAFTSFTGGGYESVIGLPHDTDGVAPYFTLSLNRLGTSDTAFYFATNDDDTTQDTSSGPDSFFILDGTFHDYALVKAGPFVRFYIDGVKQVGDYFGSSVSSLGTGTHQPFQIFPGGAVAKVNFAAAWSRDASGDFASLLADKNQLVTASGGGGSTSNAARRRQNIQ
jgi:hypothetical protein